MANALIPQRIEQTRPASVCLHGRMTQEAAVRSLERHIVRPLRADLFAVHLKAESIGKNKAKVVSMADLLPWLNATGRGLQPRTSVVTKPLVPSPRLTLHCIPVQTSLQSGRSDGRSSIARHGAWLDDFRRHVGGEAASTFVSPSGFEEQKMRFFEEFISSFDLRLLTTPGAGVHVA